MILKNDRERRQFLDEYEKWPIFLEISELNLTVRRYVLPDETAIYSFDHGEHTVYKDITIRSERKEIITPGEKFGNNPAGITDLISLVKKFKEI